MKKGVCIVGRSMGRDVQPKTKNPGLANDSGVEGLNLYLASDSRGASSSLPVLRSSLSWARLINRNTRKTNCHGNEFRVKSFVYFHCHQNSE